MNKILISPSILSADFACLERSVSQAEAGGADWIHLDVMDGRFVPNLTFGPIVVSAVKRLTKLPLDVHLMIVEPEKYIEQFRGAGADWITFHIEASNHPERLIRHIQSTGAKAGISLNPATSEDTIKYLLSAVDLVLLMTVNPGFGGQKFIPAVKDKISRLAEMRESAGAGFLIEVDGGVDPDNAGELAGLGVDVLAAGWSFFKNPDPAGGGEKNRKTIFV